MCNGTLDLKKTGMIEAEPQNKNKKCVQDLVMGGQVDLLDRIILLSCYRAWHWQAVIFVQGRTVYASSKN